MEELGKLFQAVKDIAKKNPDYFLLLVFVLALLFPFYKEIIKVDFEQYLLFVAFVVLTSITFLVLVQTPQQASRIRQELINKHDSLEDKINNIEDIFKKCIYAKSRIKLIDIERKQLNDYYCSYIEKAEKIDIIAFSGETFTRVVRQLKINDEIRFSKFKEKIIKGKCRIRVLLLKFDDPTLNSNKLTDFLWRDRADRDDNRNLPNWYELIEEDREFWVKFKEEIKTEYLNGPRLGEITIQYHPFTPCYAYFRADDTMAIGLYLYFKSGRDSPTFQITEESAPELYASFKEDFGKIWKDHRNKLLIKVNRDGIYPHLGKGC